jgi:hypothetical protein
MIDASSVLRIREIGSFHLGGRMLRREGLPVRGRVSTPGGPVHPIDPNGEVMAGQMYVQYVRLAEPRSAAPLLLWHGGGMTGVTWDYFRTAKEFWKEIFRLGPAGSWHVDPARRRMHPGSRFPAAQFETYFRQSVPRWGCNDEATQQAYDALLQRLPAGAILFTPSWTGCAGASRFSENLAAACPNPSA